MKQAFPRHSLTRGATTATRLIAQAQASTPVAESTMEYPEGQGRQVIRNRAREGFVLGRAVVLTGQVFYLVASPKFVNCYYVVVRHGEAWQCSSREEQIARRCIEQVEARRRAGRRAA